MPNIVGTLGPYMSASSRPTRAPRRLRAIARFAATVLFPTPPLPLITSTTALTMGTGSSGAGSRLGSSRGMGPLLAPPRARRQAPCLAKAWHKTPPARSLSGSAPAVGPLERFLAEVARRQARNERGLRRDARASIAGDVREHFARSGERRDG